MNDDSAYSFVGDKRVMLLALECFLIVGLCCQYWFIDMLCLVEQVTHEYEIHLLLC